MSHTWTAWPCSGETLIDQCLTKLCYTIIKILSNFASTGSIINSGHTSKVAKLHCSQRHAQLSAGMGQAVIDNGQMDAWPCAI